MAKLTTYNIATCLVVAIGGFTFGFGSAVFVSSIGQPGFYMYFKLDPDSSRKSFLLLQIDLYVQKRRTADSVTARYC